VRRARSLALRVRAISCGEVGTASAFLLDARTLVTNRHVVEGARRLDLETWDGRRARVGAVTQGVGPDLGIVRLRGGVPAGMRPARLADADPRPGARVHAIGFPGGGRLRVTSGRVLDTRADVELGSLGRIVRVTARIRPGNSGGPLVDGTGFVVGVVYAIERSTGHGLAVPVSGFRLVLEEPSDLREVTPAC